MTEEKKELKAPSSNVDPSLLGQDPISKDQLMNMAKAQPKLVEEIPHERKPEDTF